MNGYGRMDGQRIVPTQVPQYPCNCVLMNVLATLMNAAKKLWLYRFVFGIRWVRAPVGAAHKTNWERSHLRAALLVRQLSSSPTAPRSHNTSERSQSALLRHSQLCRVYSQRRMNNISVLSHIPEPLPSPASTNAKKPSLLWNIAYAACALAE